MSASSSDDGSFGEWDDADVDLPVTSFFGAHTLPSASAAWAELRDATGVDIPSLSASHRWGTYELVRVVNLLRAAGARAIASGGDVRAALAAAVAPSVIAPGAPLWTDDTALLPVLADDALLMAVITGDAAGVEDVDGAADADGEPADTGDAATAQVQLLRAELARARALILRLTSSSRDEAVGDASSSGAESDGCDADERPIASGGGGGGGGPVPMSAAAGDQFVSTSRGYDVHSYYFDSYGSATGIHRTMLADAPRTNAYRDALKGGAMKGLRVLDLGCGSGVLSLFAAADAAAVVALDASSVIDDCATIIRTNGAAERVAVVYGRAEDVPLARVKTAREADLGRDDAAPAAGRGFAVLVGALAPEVTASSDERCFDAIVSEWMGYGLLYESMLASVITVRDRFLRPGGLMLPSVASLFVGLVSSAELWTEKVDWWRNVYGFDMSVMTRYAFPEPIVEALPADALASAAPHARFARLALTTLTHDELDVNAAPFSLTVAPGTGAARDADGKVLVHALAVWFDVEFGGERFAVGGGAPVGGGAAAASESRVVLDTAPTAPPTHWMHTILLFETPIAAKEGETMRGTISMLRDARNPRQYRFTVEVEGGRKQSWHMK